jgi:hypothetical protein
VTPQAVLDSLKRAQPVCVICRGASKHPPILGDGPPRCFPCVMRLVRLSTEAKPT